MEQKGKRDQEFRQKKVLQDEVDGKTRLKRQIEKVKLRRSVFLFHWKSKGLLFLGTCLKLMFQIRTVPNFSLSFL